MVTIIDERTYSYSFYRKKWYYTEFGRYDMYLTMSVRGRCVVCPDANLGSSMLILKLKVLDGGDN